MDVAEKWGLPPGFRPIRFALSDATKESLRSVLNPNEPVIISISNEGDTVAIVATPTRVFSIKTTEMSAGASGASVRVYPWEGIFDLTMTPMTHNIKIAIEFRSSDGRTVEVGRKAKLAKPKTEQLTPFETVGGQEAFRGLLQIWNYKRSTAEE